MFSAGVATAFADELEKISGLRRAAFFASKKLGLRSEAARIGGELIGQYAPSELNRAFGKYKRDAKTGRFIR